MAGHGSKYSRLKEKAIVGLLKHPTCEKAAAEAGISPRQLRRWMQTADFKKDYAAARHQAFEEALGSLQTGRVLANAAFFDLVAPTSAPAIRLRAACAIYDYTQPAIDEIELDRCFSEMKKQLEAITKRDQEILEGIVEEN